MRIKPIITEKSLALAKEGKYTFAVAVGLNKLQIKRIIGKIFGVNVVSVNTANYPQITKKNFRGRKIRVMPYKKALVILKEKEKIDLFEAKNVKK